MSTAFAVLHRSATAREDQAGCPLGREASAARSAPDLRCGSSRWLVKGRLASNPASQREALAGCPLGREASAARPAPDPRCGSLRRLVKGRLASNRASQRSALAGCPLGREASAARPAPDLRCGSSRWLVKGRLASNHANQRAALAGCPLGREASAARPAPDLPPGKAHSRPPKVRRGPCVGLAAKSKCSDETTIGGDFDERRLVEKVYRYQTSEGDSEKKLAFSWRSRCMA